jgi:dipeptidyl aminopeptidase/acylaminoacyl peptidase
LVKAGGFLMAAGATLRAWKGPIRAAILIAAIVFILWLTGCMERLFYYPTPGPTPPPLELGPVEPVSFESRDGTVLSGWFLPAQAASENEPAATIIHVHGNAGNILDHIAFTEYLPASGFNLFIFDYRGYGQSEGRAIRREGLIEDTHAALDAMLARDDIDPDRIGVFGQSLGGAIALNVMAERSEIRAAVIMASFTSWRDMAASAVAGDPPAWPGRALAGVLIPDECRPIDVIQAIERPLMLIHGDVDAVVPVSHGRRLSAAAGANVEYHEIAGGNHNDLRWTHPEVDALTIEFFRRCLAPTSDVRGPP